VVPTQIRPGETITLSWQTEDATRVVITNLTNAPTSLPADGSHEQLIDATTTFTLTAYNGSQSVSAIVTVEVDPTLPIIISFTANTYSITADRASLLPGLPMGEFDGI